MGTTGGLDSTWGTAINHVRSSVRGTETSIEMAVEIAENNSDFPFHISVHHWQLR